MHFIAEACHKKSLEPIGLAYSRGGSAIAMGVLFLSFCGYLIGQIYNDNPLIQISTEEISDYLTAPDIELCLQNSSLTVVQCTVLYYNWTMVDIPNCWQRFFRPGANNMPTRCYVFESNNTYRLAPGLTYDNRDALRRMDFYWNIDDLNNVSYSSISLPAISVQLYDPYSSPWKPSTIGDTLIEKQIFTDISLGSSRATSYMNHVSSIVYHPQKYRAIKPGDPAAVFGLKPNYFDIMTLPNFQYNWPIQENFSNPYLLDRSLYHGLLSVQLVTNTIDVKTEVRQHTVLAAIALAGGGYGILTTIYIFLFGMTRMTPWGAVHRIPTMISKGKNHAKDDMSNDENGYNQYKNNGNNRPYIPWFFQSRTQGDKTYTSNDKNDTFMRRMLSKKDREEDEDEMHHLETLKDKQQVKHSSSMHLLATKDDPRDSLCSGVSTNSLTEEYLSSPLPQYVEASSSQNSNSTNNASSSSRQDDRDARLDNISNLLLSEQQRSTELSNRVEELEVILKEYFIDTEYLDRLRARRSFKLIHDDETNNKQ